MCLYQIPQLRGKNPVNFDTNQRNLWIDANRRIFLVETKNLRKCPKAGIQNGILTPEVLEAGCHFCGQCFHPIDSKDIKEIPIIGLMLMTGSLLLYLASIHFVLMRVQKSVHFIVRRNPLILVAAICPWSLSNSSDVELPVRYRTLTWLVILTWDSYETLSPILFIHA